MAVNLDAVEKTLEDLEREITCAICQEHYTDPKILPCLHCYCKECILKLSFKVGQDKPFPCPECRKDTVFAEGGEKELKSAFIINRLKSMYLKHKKALSKKVTCEICTNTEALAEAFCRQCDKLACKNCVHMHSLMKAIFEGHECVPIEHFQNIQSEDLIPKYPEPKKCSTHGEQLKIFCFDCNKLICRDCTVKDHRDHNIEFNNVAADNKKIELMEALKPLRKEKELVSQVLIEVAEAENEILAQKKAATDKIESSFEELNKILEMRKNQLIEEVKSVTEEKVETLIMQKKKLTIASEEIHSVIDHTEQCVRLCSDDEVMSMQSEVSSRIQAQIRECCEQKTNLKVPKKVNIIVEVDCADALQQFCKGNTWISNSAAIKSTLNFLFKEIPETMVVNEEIKFEMSIKPDKIVSTKNLNCQFQCISTGAKSTAKIKHSSSCSYDILYMPTERGRHVLEISLYGHPVPGSPFAVSAYAQPMQLKMPAKIWKDITSPFDITVNSQLDILVVEHNKALTVFSKAGYKIRTIDMKSLLVSGLPSVAVDCEHNIYYVGLWSTQLGKCDSHFNNIFVRDVQRVGGRGHYNIAVVEDEVLVTEDGNKGQIAVYDKDLNFVRHISTVKKVEFHHLCPDSHGNLYASTREGTIEVLNMNGYILRSFSQDQNKVEMLKNPWHVNIYGPYVYVTDCHLKKTVVFTTEGQYVSTFGHYGPLCVDEDGIIYHCDFINDRICIY